MNNTKPDKCPTCDSPSPERHPAVQAEGEVQPCSDDWHEPETSQMLARRQKRTMNNIGDCTVERKTPLGIVGYIGAANDELAVQAVENNGINRIVIMDEGQYLENLNAAHVGALDAVTASVLKSNDISKERLVKTLLELRSKRRYGV